MLSFEKALTADESWALAAYVRSLIGVRGHSPATASANEAIRQQRLGMMIDMPGMGPTRMMRSPALFGCYFSTHRVSPSASAKRAVSTEYGGGPSPRSDDNIGF